MTSDPTWAEVIMTSDGAARGNPGPGGWAVLLERGANEKLLSGGEPGPTTNNAMELEAVIQGLRALRRSCRVLLRADSQYVLGGIERLQRGEIFSETRKNGERWTTLKQLLAQHDVRFEWVRGHNGDARNERVDRAANAEANGFVVITPATHVDGDAPTWRLVVTSPGSDRPARWQLDTGEQQQAGEVALGRDTQATAIYRALLAGLQVALTQPDAAKAHVAVQSNFELLIKQCNGEWRVKNAAQQPLAAEVALLRGQFLAVSFTYSKEVRP